MKHAVKNALAAASRFMEKRRVVLGALLALALAGVLALYNISSGPLHNLNDIGGWDNRVLFIAMTACVHAAVLMLGVLLSRVSFARTALRQVILTAGLYILLLAINHKSYAYVNVFQPVIRAMDAGGLSAGVAMEHPMSAPMLLLVYWMTRGSVYDMYLLKLFAMACYLCCALLITRAADRRGLGIRAEVLLALCMILPQGFMNAAFSALPEIGAVTLLGVSLTLLFGMDRERPLAASLCYGAACALSGACLYALPVYVCLVLRGRVKKMHLLAALGAALLACLPAAFAGMPVSQALLSLVKANFGLPQYASGAPGLMNLVPFAAVENMPQYAPILSHFETLDTVTHAQPYYTQAHFEQMAAGVLLAGLAVYMGVCALAWRAKEKPALHRVMILVLGALIACPNVTSAAWLAADLLCLYALLAAPRLRLPACMVLFATMTSSAYPMTEEVMLPMVYAFVLCLLALLMLLGVVPMGKEEAHE